MQVKAVLFDLGWTLIKTADVPEIYRRILEIHGVHASLDEILEAHKVNDGVDVVAGMIRWGQSFWIRWNLKFLEKLGIRKDREFLAKKIDELWWEYADLEVYPDVIPTLTQLRAKGVKTGVITNGLRKDYEQILEKLNLTRYFDVVVGIDTCCKGKPDREIFLFAIDKLRVRPRETIFVGDSLKYDYEGAKRAGLKPLLIDREGKAPANAEKIKSLTDVLKLL